ncbi:MAG: NADH-quinone oxidoreductase subunit J [Verrucomicrobiae bacterium]|nr:NADH-quinone oxidoreductase subunit J [Verrucomicrobiae bacterium]
MATDLLFYLFAGLALVCGFLTVANPFDRSPVSSALFLVLTMVWLSGLFVLLHAFFIAAVQILVYAGAVMVLFLFVIMLLDLKEEERRRWNRFGIVTGVVAVIALFGILVVTLLRVRPGTGLEAELEGSTHALGMALFQQYLLPFEIVSVLLLVAMLGVILLSRRELKAPARAAASPADNPEP